MLKTSKQVYVFDLDGVITNAKDSQVNDEVVECICRLLQSESYVAINTGRSFEWVNRSMLERIKARNSSDIFDNFIAAICEKGGETVILWKGRWTVVPSEFALPRKTYDATRATFDQNAERLKTMFWDETKRTMATIEKLPAADLDAFHEEQSRFVNQLSTSLQDYEVRIDATTIAIDVESPSAGKDAGAQLIHRWIASLEDVSDCSFISIGDSASDYEMARYFAKHAAHSTFVYVGKPTDKIVQDDRVTFVSTKAHYADGTLEFLASQLYGAVATK